MPHDTTETPEKRCTVCGEEFPATTGYFYKYPNKSGLEARCKKCHNLYSAKNRQEKREERAAYNREYYATHREERAAYYAARREKYRARAATREAEHHEEYLAYHADYRAKNREKIIAARSSPHGKELSRIQSQNRRALKKAQGDTITKAEYDAVLAAHTNRKGQVICAWCSKPIKGGWHYDHWIPLDKGGRHEAGNLRVMHGWTGDKCNLHKSDILPFDFGKLI